MVQPVPAEMVPNPHGMVEPEMGKRGWFHRARPVMIHIDDVPEYRVRDRFNPGKLGISVNFKTLEVDLCCAW